MSYNINNGFVAEIKEIIHQAKKQVYNSVNTAMVVSYWLIGKRIIEEEQNGEKRADYGKFIVKSLAIALGKEFGRGFSKRSLWEYRQFYTVFSVDEIMRTLSALSLPKNTNDSEIQIVRTLFAQLSWSHILCFETDTDIAKYSILKGNEQLFASKYKLYLPTEEELRAEIEKEKLNFKLQMEQNNEG